MKYAKSEAPRRGVRPAASHVSTESSGRTVRTTGRARRRYFRPSVDGLDLLRRDHENVHGEFDGFQTAGGDDRYFLAHRFLRQLERYVRLAGDVFYPLLQARAERQGSREVTALVRDAWKAHLSIEWHVVKVKEQALEESFIFQIDGLMQRVRDHIEREEGQVFPVARTLLGGTGLSELGRLLLEREKELTSSHAA